MFAKIFVPRVFGVETLAVGSAKLNHGRHQELVIMIALAMYDLKDLNQVHDAVAAFGIYEVVFGDGGKQPHSTCEMCVG